MARFSAIRLFEGRRCTTVNINSPNFYISRSVLIYRNIPPGVGGDDFQFLLTTDNTNTFKELENVSTSVKFI